MGGASSTFVGREHELAALHQAQGLAAEGRPGLVLVTGEAGAGKSRLVAEALTGQAQLLLGRCIPLTGASLPYAPWIEVLRGIDGAACDLADRLLRPGDAVGSFTGGRGPAQASLLDAIDGVLAAAAGSAPLVVWLEDLHWADQPTLDTLAFVARRRRGQRLLLVVTLRAEDPGPWQRVVAELSRLQATTCLELSALRADEVKAVLGSAPASQQASPRLVQDVLAATGGNAYLVTELARVLVPGRPGDGPLPLPGHLRGLLRDRLRDLPPSARALVEVLAALARPAPDRLLELVLAGQGVDAVSGARSARAAGVVVLDPVTQHFALRHGLMQTTVYEDMLPAERRTWHAAVARALVSRPTRDPMSLAEVAEHWYRADRPEEALPAAVQAGRHALAVVAPEQAWTHLSRALEMWPDTPGPTLDRGEVLAMAASAARWCGDTVAALRMVHEALELPALTLQNRAALEERAGRYCYEDGRWQEASAAYARAAVALSGLPASPLSAQVLAAQASMLMLGGRHTAAVEAATRAVEQAAAAGAEVQQVYALTTLGVSQSVLGRTSEGVAALERALVLAHVTGDVETLLRAEAAMSVSLDRAGRPEQALPAAQRALDLTIRYQLTGNLGMATVANVVDLLRMLGRWDDAQALVDTSLAPAADTTATAVSASATHRAFLLTVRGALAVGQGRFAAALVALDEAEALTDLQEPDSAVLLLAARIELELWQGRPASVWPVLDRALDLMQEAEDVAQISHVCALGVRAAADEVLAVRRTDDDRVQALVARGLSLRLHASPSAGGSSLEASAWVATAEAEAGRLVGEDDAAAWGRAGQAWADVQRPYEQAYCAWRQGASALGQGRRSVAEKAVRHAHEFARQLGANPLTREIEALARRARLDLQSTEPAPAAPPAPHGLTAREAEVLALLACGRTNRQVAKELFISERTAGVHVSHVLAKLQVTNRAEAGACAHRLGLVPPPVHRDP